MISDSPAVARWELALRLRQRQTELSVPVAAVAKAVRGFTTAHWGAAMAGRRVIAADKLAEIAAFLEFPERERDELLQLRQAGAASGWWADYPAVFDETTARMLGLEHGAYAVRLHESLRMPALLESPDYLHAKLTGRYGVRSEVQVEQHRDVGARRRELLSRPDPLRVTALLNQAALLSHPWGVQVQLAQLRHLAGLIEEHPDTVDIRVIPLGAPEAVALHSVCLLDFASPRMPTVAWHDTAPTGVLVDDPAAVTPLATRYDTVLDATPSRESALTMIHLTAQELAAA